MNIFERYANNPRYRNSKDPKWLYFLLVLLIIASVVFLFGCASRQTTYDERASECIRFLKAKNKYCWDDTIDTGNKNYSDYEYGFEVGKWSGYGDSCMDYLEWKHK